MSDNEDSRNPAGQSRDGTRAYAHAIRHVSEGRDLLAPGNLMRQKNALLPNAIADQKVRESLLVQLKRMNVFEWMQSTVTPEDIAAVQHGEPPFRPETPVYASFINLTPDAFKAAVRFGKNEKAVIQNFRVLMRELIGPDSPLAITPANGARALLVVTDAKGLAQFRQNTQPQRGVRI